ncbi:lactonase family protein [Flavisolibacter tropicus]|uniref:6-phosphogluconolactonase n=1 Tax=Flavisolibacter tropicus TaxID=1492898 RepID=A0A172TY97_9BACT|nr:lactonase family protein [Flavisolibacter tropicus]ANE51962.1 6-phosphogluconolactonase [Flavisolibacter tropicus]
MKSLLPLALVLLTNFHLFAQKTFVFLGSYNWDKTTEGIYVYQLDTKTGLLTKATSVKDVYNPSFLTLSPDGKFVYACTESKTPNAGSVSSFSFNPQQQTLTYINSQKSGGENPVYVSVHRSGKWLVNGNYTEASVSVYPLAASGEILPATQHMAYTDSSINKERQDRAHIHSTVFSLNADYLFLPDLGADKIRCYQFDSTQTAPLKAIEKPFVQAVLGSGPRHFTFHPNGKFAYCIEEMGGAVSVYKYDKGRLDSIQRIDTHNDKYKEGFESSDVHISPDGRFLYATNRGKENNIAIFAIAKNGKLKNIGYQPTLGEHPRTFAIDPSSQFLIVTNVVSESVTVFKRNGLTGLLSPTGQELKVKNVSCVQIKQY